jgi:hypothetical protein
MADPSTREWIESRYGKVSIEARRIVVACVPTLKGAAMGVGFSQDEAIEKLKENLTVPGSEAEEITGSEDAS